MAHRVIFWCPRSGIDVWLPANRPLGETIREVVLSGSNSEFLGPFPAEEMLQCLATAFPQSRTDKDGKLHWSDECNNGFVACAGRQFVEVGLFDLAEENLNTIFTVAEGLGCEHYDWGN